MTLSKQTTKNSGPMEIIKYPKENEWEQLCLRPTLDTTTLAPIIADIFEEVRTKGDQALKQYASQFDGVQLSAIEYDLTQKSVEIAPELKEAIELAKSNIETFHHSQKEEVEVVETSPGVTCWRKSLPIENVGLYIPGGSAPLFSTLLMLAIPAKIAGCKNIVLCTPPLQSAEVNDVIAWTARLLGFEKIYLAGGAQAIAAMTFGTETIPKVDKIFGPGNQYVTAAKQYAQNFGVAIDMPAGPSEVLVIADQTSNPEFVAADLLSQAEHGPDSQVVLVSDSEEMIMRVTQEVQKQLRDLPRKEIAARALENSRSILFKTLDEAMNFSNAYAPEHLIIATANAEALAGKVTQAGSVFLGTWSCESAGDYASGTNHTLPTNGYAKNYSGVSLDSFVKKITFQKLSEAGIQNLGPAIEKMAAAEQLIGHKNAVTVRLNYIYSKNVNQPIVNRQKNEVRP